MDAKPILIVGGAGYIGSHTAKFFAQCGYIPIVIDNLSYGHQEFVKWGSFYQGDIQDISFLKYVIREHRPVGCIHFAAYISVGESVVEPIKYYQNNVGGTISLLQALLACGIELFVFSSTAAVYGDPRTEFLGEDHPKNPVSPYGKSKWMIEQILGDFDVAYRLRSVSLRYFNASGADPELEIGEDHHPETHLIPLVLDAAMKRRNAITIFGEDYPTPDGTCIRDYIHVMDLAQAHYLAFEYLIVGGKTTVLNLGNGHGFSVRKVIQTAEQISGGKIPIQTGHRRQGDPPVLVADSSQAKIVLKWCPKYPNLEQILTHAWGWHQKRFMPNSPSNGQAK